MLADKTLLSVTLAATFASGTFVGLAITKPGRGAGVPPMSATAIYAPQIAQFEAKGYDDAEMADVRQAYTDYLKGYDYWWGEFVVVHSANLDTVDKKLDKRLEALAVRHAERTGSK